MPPFSSLFIHATSPFFTQLPVFFLCFPASAPSSFFVFPHKQPFTSRVAWNSPPPISSPLRRSASRVLSHLHPTQSPPPFSVRPNPHSLSTSTLTPRPQDKHVRFLIRPRLPFVFGSCSAGPSSLPSDSAGDRPPTALSSPQQLHPSSTTTNRRLPTVDSPVSPPIPAPPPPYGAPFFPASGRSGHPPTPHPIDLPSRCRSPALPATTRPPA